MPDGKTHEKLRKKNWIIAWLSAGILTIPFLFLNLKIIGIITVPIGVLIGYWWGKFQTPDWDIVGMTEDEGRLMNEIPVIGIYLVSVSTFYGAIFRRMHRSFWTHFPFISTAPRWILVFWPIVIYVWISTWDLAWLIFILIGMFIGNSLSDFVHWRADRSSGEIGKNIRNLRNKK